MKGQITLVELIVIGAIFLIILSVISPVLGGCNATYSEGSRVGYITKFSLKGYAIKTHEGEMNLGGVRSSRRGSVADTWGFSVTDPAVVEAVNEAMESEHCVKLHYRQVFVRSTWKGSSDYLVTKVEVLKEEPAKVEKTEKQE